MTTIRKATNADALALTACMKAAYEPLLSKYELSYLPPLDVDYADEIKNYPTYVIEFENKVVGGLIFNITESEFSIANIAIDPRVQGKRLGQQLMSFSEDVAKQKGFNEIYLGTHVLFADTLVFYKRLGYEELERDDTRLYLKKELF